MISEELATFLAAGHSGHIATRGERLEPDGARAWAIVVDPDRIHVTAYVMKAAASGIVENLSSHPEVALTVDRVIDHVTWQLKGAAVEVRPARAGEKAEVVRQADGFIGSLEAIGISRRLTANWRYWPCVAVRLRVTEIFNQTPGPGAGERVK